MPHRNAVSEKLYGPTKVLSTSSFDCSHASGFMTFMVVVFQIELFCLLHNYESTNVHLKGWIFCRHSYEIKAC